MTRLLRRIALERDPRLTGVDRRAAMTGRFNAPLHSHAWPWPAHQGGHSRAAALRDLEGRPEQPFLRAQLVRGRHRLAAALRDASALVESSGFVGARRR